jgi:allantoicase
VIAPTAADLLAACGSPGWVAAVGAAAPFTDLTELLAVGERTWWSLTEQDWKDALAAHPRIGDRPAAGTQEQREQSAAQDADVAVLEEIAAGNRRYEETFGFTYVVRASGRSAPEMLAMLQDRLGNDPLTELEVAAAQQWEITALRLHRRYEETTQK